MKLLFSLLTAAMLCALLLVGCGQTPPAEPAAPVEEPPVDFLTGDEPLYLGKRPVAVMVSNAFDSPQQQGIAAASVVLEARTAADTTELCLLYPSVDTVPQVGPVVQGRDLYWHFLNGLNALPVQKGASRYAANFLDFTAQHAVDALVVGTNAFSHAAGRPAANDTDWSTSGAALSSVLGSLALSADGESRPLSRFGTPERGIIGAAIIDLHFTADTKTFFAFDGATKTYFMHRPDSAPMLDANNGAQAAFDNLLLLCVDGVGRKDDGSTPDYEGAEGLGLYRGTGYYIFHGAAQAVHWARSDDGETLLTLTDAADNVIPLAAGRTYIALLGMGGLDGQRITLQDVSRTVTLNTAAAPVVEPTAEDAENPAA